MNKSQKPTSPAARQQMKPLTPEEQKEQQMRMYIQKKASLAEGILFNLMQNPSVLEMKGSPVKLANNFATEFMKEVYLLDVIEKKPEEE